MTTIVYIISAFIIISKFLDCYTTSSQITAITQEKNPIASKIMERIGIQTTIWGFFGLSALIVSISVWSIFRFYDTLLYKSLYVILGLFISLIQFAVAHTNQTKRLNRITRFLLNKS